MKHRDNPAYNCWKKMRDRCNNPANHNYLYYGAKGIKVCARWNSFEAFDSDMGPRPSPQHTIDRINPNKDYAPDNCRWATAAEQARNRSRHVWVNVDGVKTLAVDLARSLGVHRKVIYSRIKAGWSDERMKLPPTDSRFKSRQDQQNDCNSLIVNEVRVPSSSRLSGTNSNADK